MLSPFGNDANVHYISVERKAIGRKGKQLEGKERKAVRREGKESHWKERKAIGRMQDQSCCQMYISIELNKIYPLNGLEIYHIFGVGKELAKSARLSRGAPMK